jgi:hypothetical protein
VNAALINVKPARPKTSSRGASCAGALNKIVMKDQRDMPAQAAS